LYNELYEAWRQERDNAELQPLSKDFYVKLAEYVRKSREEGRMLDAKTTRGRLLMHEAENVRKMVRELVSLRHSKAVQLVSRGEAVSVEGLTKEEEKLFRDVSPSFEVFQGLLKEIEVGRLPQAGREKPRNRVLRFLKETPVIVGVDMKTYGPFQPEDVASVPAENAKVLTKQGIAVEVDVQLEPR
jgi:DNA replication initiation complex subunit (GINS family)